MKTADAVAAWILMACGGFLVGVNASDVGVEFAIGLIVFACGLWTWTRLSFEPAN